MNTIHIKLPINRKSPLKDIFNSYVFLFSLNFLLREVFIWFYPFSQLLYIYIVSLIVFNWEISVHMCNHLNMYL